MKKAGLFVLALCCLGMGDVFGQEVVAQNLPAAQDVLVPNQGFTWSGLGRGILGMAV